jgi:hypothetical protein
MHFILPDHRLAKTPALVENIGVPEFYCDGAVTRDCGEVVKVLCFLEYDEGGGAVARHQNVLIIMKRSGFGVSFLAAASHWLPVFATPGSGLVAL